MPMVEFSAVLDGDSGRIWDVLKKFGEIHVWHPAITESHIEDNQADSLPGVIRMLRLQDGAIVRERLLAVDERNLTFSYRFEEAPLPLDNYVASVMLVPLSGQDKTFIKWSASFELREPDPQRQYEEAIRDLIVSGHDNLQNFLNRS